MKKVVVFLADGFEEIEGLTVVDVLRRAQIEVTTVSVKDSLEIHGAHSIIIMADRTFTDMNFSDTDMLVLPGGVPGTNHLAGYQPLLDLLKRFYEEGKMISAICAAPSILGVQGFLEGKKATCYPGYEDKLLQAIPVDEGVVIADNIITGKAMGTAMDFSFVLVERLVGKEMADRVAGMIYYTK
ncbi:MAG TPA: DJ-1 family glyoxalase III [Lachnospiraceae bacterium]|nr:DJ-1 family glyoxalase III [Lachnospiraceae bacterium]